MIRRFGTWYAPYQLLACVLVLLGAMSVVTEAKPSKPKPDAKKTDTKNPEAPKAEDPKTEDAKTEYPKNDAQKNDTPEAELDAESSFDMDEPFDTSQEDEPFKPGKYVGDEAGIIGKRIIDKVYDTNLCWLYSPISDAKEWSYTFKAVSVFGGGPIEKKISVGRKSGTPWEHIRGIRYIGVPQGLCEYARVGKVEYRQIEVTAKEIKLHFLIAENGGAFQMAGNGIDGSWFGFFQHKILEGMLYVNPKDYTIVGVKMPMGVYEKYTNYVKQDKVGHLAPKRIEIVCGNMAFDMRFKVYKPGVWILEKSVLKLKGKETSVATTSDITVNGTPGIEVEDGN